ncbi:MAG TPA: tetratricopeptide repeat protein [Roseiflexaceae bacterium]
MTLRTDDIDDALRAVLPGAAPAAVSRLATLLAEVANGVISRDAAIARVTADQSLASLLDSLAGRQIQGRHALLSFGPDGRFGDISIRDVAGGNIVNLTFNVKPGAPAIDSFAAQTLLDAMPTDVVPDVAPLPTPHRIPLRHNELFVGRVADLKALARVLKEHQSAVAITTGIGGIGKTQLASEFAHRYGQHFAGGVFWISCLDPAGVGVEIAACGGAGAMELYSAADNLTQDEQVRRVYAAWEHHLPRLLIFDNCDDLPANTAEAQVAALMPKGGGCRVLITSRRGRWSRALGVTPLPLGVLTRAESVALLRNYRADLSDAGADALADELGDLPLALSLAGGYLATYQEEPFGELTAYLDQLRQLRLKHQSMQGKGATLSLTGHELNVWATFDLSFARLDARDRIDSMAVALLARAARLAPGEPFPRDLLGAALAVDDAPADAPETLADAIHRLVALGMLEPAEAGTLRIHRLVAMFAREAIPDESALAAMEDALIRQAYQINLAGYPAAMQRIVAHMRYLAEAATERSDARAATLSTNFGYYLRMIGNYAGARPYYAQALAIYRAVLGERHPDTARSLNNLGYLLQAQGDLAGARPYYAQALAICEARLGAEHPTTRTIRANLAALDAPPRTAEQQIAEIAQQAESAVAQVFAAGTPDDRATLAAQLEARAQWAEEGEEAGSPYLALAAHLRALAAQLTAGDSSKTTET